MDVFLSSSSFLNPPGGDITISNQKGMDQSLLNSPRPPTLPVVWAYIISALYHVCVPCGMSSSQFLDVVSG
jgi:hypothetical protein